MASPNFLLGKGEELTHELDYSGGGGDKLDPYGLAEQKDVIGKRLKKVLAAIKALPDGACPNDEAVAMITLHPAYLSKSSFPDELLAEAGLRAIGSRERIITPRKVVSSDGSKLPQPTASAEIFVAGKRQSFESFAKQIPNIQEETGLGEDLLKVEDFRVQTPAEKIQAARTSERELLMEFVLHAGPKESADFIRVAFKEYLASLNVPVDLTKRIDAGQLSFVAVRISRSKAVEAAKFSFLRTTRDMPRLRQLQPTKQGGALNYSFKCSITNTQPLDPTIELAIFDGGIPDVPSLRPCVVLDESFPDLAEAVPSYQQHGLAVTSACLFGPLPDNGVAPQPYARVHHFRVLDANTANDPQDELYPVLRRIASVLGDTKRRFEFVGLSIGPDIPLDDKEVHPWTATLDELLSHGNTLACFAAGNSGEADDILGYNRVQPPADCVNAVAVGACDTQGPKWQRASYSSVGFGRRPGFIKPDGIAFGGSEDQPFWTLEFLKDLAVVGERGTSFAGPLLLRSGVGVRAQMAALSPLAIRALLIHKCERNPRSKSHKMKEVGWGRFTTDVERLIACVTSGATVVYQGSLPPKKVLRAEIPMPVVPIEGSLTLSATIVFATEIDPQDPVNYTRSSVSATFRKDKNNILPERHTAESDAFFDSHRGMSEVQLRRDAGKWETTLHKTKSFDSGLSFRAPVFDLHYIPRESGRDAKNAKKIPYAMIISISAPEIPDMFDHIWNRYRHKLKQLQPRYRVTTRKMPRG